MTTDHLNDLGRALGDANDARRLAREALPLRAGEEPTPEMLGSHRVGLLLRRVRDLTHLGLSRSEVEVLALRPRILDLGFPEERARFLDLLASGGNLFAVLDDEAGAWRVRTSDGYFVALHEVHNGHGHFVGWLCAPLT